MKKIYFTYIGFVLVRYIYINEKSKEFRFIIINIKYNITINKYIFDLKKLLN